MGREGSKIGVINCSECNSVMFLSPRRVRAIKALAQPRLCPACRRGEPVVTEEIRQWVRDTFTESEIVEIAEAIWGDRDTWR